MQITRRDLIQRAGLAAGIGALGGVWSGTARAESRSTNEKLNIGCIGVGGQGGGDIGFFTGENIVALCDVDDARAADTFKRFPDAKRYKDFRKMLEQERTLDAVSVSTPDHIHAPAAVMAMKQTPRSIGRMARTSPSASDHPPKATGSRSPRARREEW